MYFSHGSYGHVPQCRSSLLAATPRLRNVLFTCLGSPGKPVVDTVGPLLMQAGDRLLLCSDGLWGTVSDSEIAEQLSSLPLSDSVPELEWKETEAKARALLRAAELVEEGF